MPIIQFPCSTRGTEDVFGMRDLFCVTEVQFCFVVVVFVVVVYDIDVLSK
jgi:hypothetical protein